MNVLHDSLNEYSWGSGLSVAAFAILGAVVAGTIADRVMRDRGFGIVGNGILIVMGVCLGLWFADLRVGPADWSSANRLLLLCVAAATAVLLVCGVVKSALLNRT